MFFKIFSIIFGIYSSISCLPSNTEATCLNAYAGKSISPAPINIESAKVKEAETKIPVTLYNALFGFLNFTNSGKTVITYTDQRVDPSSIAGGVLCNIPFQYKIYTIIFFINQDPNGRSGHAIDGKGLPIEAWVVYYNKFHGSLEQAQKFPNGIIILAFPVGVGKISSASFVGFQKFLSTGVLKKPYSSSKLFGLIGYSWFDHIASKDRYYGYTGSYSDPITGKRISGAKILLIDPKQAPYISNDQFAAFKNVLALNGKPVNFTSPIYSQGSREVYKGDGMAQKFIPIP